MQEDVASFLYCCSPHEDTNLQVDMTCFTDAGDSSELRFGGVAFPAVAVNGEEEKEDGNISGALHSECGVDYIIEDLLSISGVCLEVQNMLLPTKSLVLALGC